MAHMLTLDVGCTFLMLKSTIGNLLCLLLTEGSAVTFSHIYNNFSLHTTSTKPAKSGYLATTSLTDFIPLALNSISFSDSVNCHQQFNNIFSLWASSFTFIFILGGIHFPACQCHISFHTKHFQDPSSPDAK